MKYSPMARSVSDCHFVAGSPIAQSVIHNGNHFGAGSLLGYMQKESPSQDGLDFWLPELDCCGHYKEQIHLHLKSGHHKGLSNTTLGLF